MSAKYTTFFNVLLAIHFSAANAWNDHYDEEDDAWVLKIIIPILLAVILICIGGCFYQSYIREKTAQEEEDIYGNDKPPSYLNKQKYLPNIQPATQIYQANTKPYLSQHQKTYDAPPKPFPQNSNNFNPPGPASNQNYTPNPHLYQQRQHNLLPHTQSVLEPNNNTYGTLPFRRTTQSYNTVLNKPRFQSFRQPQLSYQQSQSVNNPTEPIYIQNNSETSNYSDNLNYQIQQLQNQQILTQGRGVNPQPINFQAPNQNFNTMQKIPRSCSFAHNNFGQNIYATLPRHQGILGQSNNLNNQFPQSFQRNRQIFRQRHNSMNGILDVPENFRPDPNLFKPINKKVNFIEDSGVSLPSSGASIEEASMRSNSPKYTENPYLPGASELAKACNQHGNGQIQHQVQMGHMLQQPQHLNLRSSSSSNSGVRRSLSMTDITRPQVQRRVPDIIGAQRTSVFDQNHNDPYLRAVQTAYEQFQPSKFQPRHFQNSRRSSINHFLEPTVSNNRVMDTTIYL